MVQRYSEIIHSLSLLDQRLNKLKHISVFMDADEYRDIHSLTQHWNCRIPYLRSTVFKPGYVDIDTLERNKFPIKLFSTVPNHSIYDSVAAIPIEFQFVVTKSIDVIAIRIDLGNNKYIATVVELNDNALSTIQLLYENILSQNPEMDKQTVFEHAYYEYIHKNSFYILSKSKNVYNSWKGFDDNFYSKYQVSTKEYSNTGKYLWHRDYILLDNRAMKDYKVFTLKSQWQEANKEDLKSIDPSSNQYFNISALFIDDNGNYWSSKEAYQKYCRFLDM